jgi:ATP-dependent Lon protease
VGLMAILEAWGGKLGILEMGRGQTPQAPSKIETRTVTLAQLSTEIRSEEVRALADQPSELTVPFDKIFETAGIGEGKKGWTVHKLHAVLSSDPLKSASRENAQKQILEILRSDEISTEEIVKDAMARDKALDSFEAFARQKMEERRLAREQKMTHLREQIEQLKKELSETESRKKSDDGKWAEWRNRKKAAEQDMAWAIGHVINRPVITIAED